jgi:hypothetical protein
MKGTKEMKKIQLTIEKETGKKLTASHRDREHVYARTIYFKLCRERTHKTLKEIGESINKNHATVLHALNNIFPMLMDYEPKFKLLYSKIANDTDLEPIEIRFEKLKMKYDVLKYQIDTLPNKLKKELLSHIE